MSLDELLDIEITTASRGPERLSESAFTSYVITADELRSLDARAFHDALLHLPGVNLATNAGGATRVFFRGAGSEFSSQVVFMIDGHVLNTPLSGSATANFRDLLPVESIERIEVVHGPVSSLYGANAFLGMINIITKNGASIGGTEASVKAEFDRGGHVANSYDVLHGTRFDNGWQTAINLYALHGDGPRLHVNGDLVGRSGFADASQGLYDVYFTAENEDLKISGRYHHRRAGNYFGFNNVLNDGSDVDTKHGFLNLAYSLHPRDDLDLVFQTSFDQYDVDAYYELFPPGAIPPGSPIYAWNPTGLISEITASQRTYTAELRGTSRGIANHTLGWGLVYRHEELYDPRQLANYVAGQPPLPSVQDVSARANWIRETSRDAFGFFLQDTWRASEHLRVTLDGRFDHYSDFGSSFNPRVGATFRLNERFLVKAVVGTAYRAPDFASQFTTATLVITGNPDIDAETITTFEVGLRAAVSDDLHFEATLFHNEMKDLIGVGPGSPRMFDNTDNVTTRGIEIEGRYAPGRNLLLRANYTFVELDYSEGYASPMAPRHSGSVIVDYRISEHLRWNVNGYAQSAGKRMVDDPREDVDGFVIVNTTLSATLTDHLAVQFSVFNLADENYAYASPVATIPGDYTAPGRSVLLALRYSL